MTVPAPSAMSTVELLRALRRPEVSGDRLDAVITELAARIDECPVGPTVADALFAAAAGVTGPTLGAGGRRGGRP